jgi:hypothetical protein
MIRMHGKNRSPVIKESGVISPGDLILSPGTGPDRASPIIMEMEREGFLFIENGNVRLR